MQIGYNINKSITFEKDHHNCRYINTLLLLNLIAHNKGMLCLGRQIAVIPVVVVPITGGGKGGGGHRGGGGGGYYPSGGGGGGCSTCGYWYINMILFPK